MKRIACATALLLALYGAAEAATIQTDATVGDHVIGGNSTVIGNETVLGNVTLGDSASDTITFTGTPTITPDLTLTGDITVNGSDVTIGAAGVKLTGDGDGSLTLTGLGDGSDETLVINLDDTANTVSISSTTSVTTISTGAIGLTSTGTVKAGTILSTPAAAQTIAEGDTIAADSCGGLKRITAAGAVTTGTTNTFTAPGATNAGCCMDVLNVGGTHTITLDANTLFVPAAAGNVALTALDIIRVCSDGSNWYQVSAVLSLN